MQLLAKMTAVLLVLAKMTAVLFGVMSLAACASIMIVSNFNNDIRGYEVGDGTRLNGNVPPDLIISSPSWGVAALYNKVFNANLSGGSIMVFEVGLGGYSSQLATIAGDATGLKEPNAVAVDKGGNIYVIDQGGRPVEQKVLVYAKGASGNVAPIATIVGSNTGLFGPSGIAVDEARRIYVANRGHFRSGPNSITVYAPGANGNASPIATITGPNTQLGEPMGIAVDADGTIFVANWENRVTTYAPGANGDVPPIAVIQGSHTGLFGPTSIALGFGHSLYVTNGFPTEKISVTVYPAGADGDVAPLATLTGSATGLGFPFGIAFACVFANSRWVDGFFPRPPGC
jgi:sugar lactone lactonase YvrE